jgi:beta-glucanase (GH16 family)
MEKLSKYSMLFFCFIWLTSCSGGSEVDEKIESPSNLKLELQLIGNGEVSATFSATNAAFFKINFGTPGEVNQRVDGNSATYTYKVKGDYTVTLRAYADEQLFVVDSKSITMNAAALGLDANAGFTSPESYSGYKLVWADEFNSATLSDDWIYEIGDGCPSNCGWGNDELEYYKKENTSLADGKLTITAKQESIGDKSYTSSRLITKGKKFYTYGRVDIRAILPKGQGMWPALWMLGENFSEVSWPKCGEIDIMEMIGGSVEDRERTVHGTVHWDNAGNYASYGGKTKLSTGIFNDEYHVFSIVWDKQKIVWLLDNVEYHVIDITPAGLDEFHKPFFFIFNVAVGGRWPGKPDGETKFPQVMKVDYIRVFQPD